jgi:putative hydrolase
MIKFDCHVHSIASGHAFGTVEEIAGYCRRYGMDGFVLTDHGPAIPGSANNLYFNAIRMLPRWLEGIQVLRGVEANLMDYEGNLDLPVELLRRLDVVIASFHEILIEPTNREDHTRALIAAANNPLIDILGHSGRGNYRYDIPAVLEACKATGTMVEINRWTIKKRKTDRDVCLDIALACRDLGVAIVINSDAHTADAVGQVDLAEELVRSINFPEELIMNRTAQVFKTNLILRKPWLKLD